MLESTPESVCLMFNVHFIATTHIVAMYMQLASMSSALKLQSGPSEINSYYLSHFRNFIEY